MSIKREILTAFKDMVKSNRELVAEVRYLRPVVESNNNEFLEGDKASSILGRKNPRILKQYRDSGILKINVDYKWNGKSFLYLKKSIERIRDNN